MNPRRRLVMATLPLAAGLVACAASVPAPVLIALPATADALPPAAPSPAAATPRLLAVRRVGVPEYLLARRVRYRSDASTVAEWPNTYWAERLEIGVTREFAAALRARLPAWDVCDAGCGDTQPTLSAHLELTTLDYLRGARRVQARGRLTLLTGSGGMPRTHSLAAEVDATADSPQAQAQAVAEAMRRLGQDAAPLIAGAQR